MGGVAGDQLEAVLDGDGGDHWIGQADAVPGAFQVAGNPPCQFGGSSIEDDDLLQGDGIQGS